MNNLQFLKDFIVDCIGNEIHIRVFGTVLTGEVSRLSCDGVLKQLEVVDDSIFIIDTHKEQMKILLDDFVSYKLEETKDSDYLYVTCDKKKVFISGTKNSKKRG